VRLQEREEGGADLALDGVRKSFGDVVAVDGVTFGVRPGEFYSLLGPSGCGKTTTLRLVAGFDRPDAGRILLRGADLTAVPPNRRSVNTVFQHYALFPHLTVADNVGYGLKQRSIPKVEAAERLERALAIVRLRQLRERYPRELSGGQQQRVACARAFIGRPEIVFGDEPTGNLDSRSGTEVLEFLRASVDTMDRTVVMVTHDPYAASYADIVVFLADGRIIDQISGPTQDAVLERMRRLEPAPAREKP
jgi:ABC-type Fe3+/spermidine/putrescine transport system ATPase subunit